MAAKKKGAKRVRRPTTPRKRLGANEQGVVKRLLAAIRRFVVFAADAKKRETSLNARLITQLKAVDARVVNRNIASVTFVELRYFPECTLSTVRAPYSLFALECKKLHDHSAKRLFKEGLAQGNVYLTRSKVVALVLYDFTTGRKYAKAFGKGNTTSSRFAARAREELGLHVIVRRAP